MPTHEAITNTVIPREVERPIPVRTVQTQNRKPESLRDQGIRSETPLAADSALAPEDSVRLSPQLSVLARKEQAHRQREQALKQREKDLEARLAEAEQYSQLKTKIGSKDYSEAEKLGLNYEEYTQYLLSKQDGQDPVTQKFKALEDQIQSLMKGKEDSATQEYEETVAAYKKETTDLLSKSSEFPLIQRIGKIPGFEGVSSEDAIFQIIKDDWEKDGKETSVEEAAKEAEAYLKSLGAALANDQMDVESDARKLPPPRFGSKTLNQNVAAVGTSQTAQKSLQHLSEAERYAEARRRVLSRLEKGN